MDIQSRISENEQKTKVIQTQLQQIQQTNQELLAELLKLAGEARLLLLLEKEEISEKAD